MFKPKTFAHLCAAMQTGAIIEIDRATGYITNIEKEDGSGYCYNVTLAHEGNVVKKFIRVES